MAELEGTVVSRTETVDGAQSPAIAPVPEASGVQTTVAEPDERVPEEAPSASVAPETAVVEETPPQSEEAVVVEDIAPTVTPEPLFSEDGTSNEGEQHKTWKERLGAIGGIAAGVGVAFALVKRLLRKREEAPTPPVTPQPSTPDAPKPPTGQEVSPEDKETHEMSKLLEKFAGRVTYTLNTYANRENEQNTHFWERWMATWGRRLNETTNMDNTYRREHGMQTLDARTRVARTIAIFAATVPALAADLLIPMATGDTVSDVLIGKLRNELYEGLTGDKLGSTATQIAELVTSFIPGVTSLNLAIAGFYELATLSRRGGRVEGRLGNARMGRIMGIVQGILDRRDAKRPAPAAT